MAESILTSTTDALLRRIELLRSPAAPPPPPHAAVSRFVEAEVIPRLQQHAGAASPALLKAGESLAWDALDGFIGDGDSRAPLAAPDVSQREVAVLARLLLKQDLRRAWCMVRMKRDAGMHTEAIAVDLLGATARYLGAEWVADRCTFADVTLGTGYLHQLLRDMTTSLDFGTETPGYHHRALLLPAPGEQHLLGLSILGETFRRRGWDVCGGPGQERDELLTLIRREHFDVIGFSVGADRWLGDLSMEIERFREASRNRDIPVMVGGYAIDTCPELVRDVGADLTAADARLAPDQVLAATSRP